MPSEITNQLSEIKVIYSLKKKPSEGAKISSSLEAYKLLQTKYSFFMYKFEKDDTYVGSYL